MARSDTRFREAYNYLLDYCETLPVGAPVPAEKSLSAMAKVSRTVVRRCLTKMEETGIISWDGRDKQVLRAPTKADRISVPKARTSSEDLEERFFDWILKFDVPAHTPL